MHKSQLRKATLDDIPQLLQLEYELFPNAMAEMTLKQELTVGQGFVVYLEPAVLGYALVREDWGKLDMTRLGVVREARGRGVGTRLLHAVVALRKPIVLTVFKTNHSAIRLYRRFGFEIVGHLPSEAAWAMRREASALTLVPGHAPYDP
jgi:ribosomal protein S18 acetylase RimI-like enzyme